MNVVAAELRGARKAYGSVTALDGVDLRVATGEIVIGFHALDFALYSRKLGTLPPSIRTVLMEDPLNERVHLAVMRLYAEQGRRDLVRRQYDKLCAILLDELGVPPMPDTTQGYHQLME